MIELFIALWIYHVHGFLWAVIAFSVMSTATAANRE